jgi:hypothetical protein
LAKNKLLFSTPAEGASLRTGTSRVLTRDRHHHHHKHHHHHHHDHHHDHDHDHHHHKDKGVKVKKYETIRLFAENRGASATSVNVVMTSTQNGRTNNYRLARVRLAPGQSYTDTYRVPGKYVNIIAYSTGYSGGCGGRGRGRIDTIDVQLYGRK